MYIILQMEETSCCPVLGCCCTLLLVLAWPRSHTVSTALLSPPCHPATLPRIKPADTLHDIIFRY